MENLYPFESSSLYLLNSVATKTFQLDKTTVEVININSSTFSLSKIWSTRLMQAALFPMMIKKITYF